MNSQTSKAALWGFERAEWLATSTATQEPLVSAELEELYRSILPQGEEDADLPDFPVVQHSNVRLLQHSTQKIRATDQTFRKARTALNKMRTRRKELAVGFKKRYRDEQKSFEGTYNKEALAEVGLDALPGTRYLTVREQLLEFRERLRDPETPARLGDPVPGHSPIDLENLADAIDGEISAYDTLMTEIREQIKKTDELRIANAAGQDDHRRVVVNVARVLEGYYRLVGLPRPPSTTPSRAPPRSARGYASRGA